MRARSGCGSSLNAAPSSTHTTARSGSDLGQAAAPTGTQAGGQFGRGLQNQLVQAQAPPVNLSHVIGAGWVEPLLPIHAHDN